MATMTSWRHPAAAWLALAGFLSATMLAPLPGGGFGVAEAFAADKPRVVLFELGRRGNVRSISARRVSEFLRAMLEANGDIDLLSQKVVRSGKDDTFNASGGTKKKDTRAMQQLAKADQALLEARSMLDAGEDPGFALKLLSAAIKRYEQYFVELVDFTKLVDAYARSAGAALLIKKKRDAQAFITKALTIQPTFVIDARRSPPELVSLVAKTRTRLQRKRKVSIEVSATLPGASVFVDGVKIGAAPATASDLIPGDHFVQVRARGASDWGNIVNARRGTKRVNAELERDGTGAPALSIMARYEDMTKFTASGEFHERLFRNYSTLFAKQLAAEALVYGTLADGRRPGTIELHLFVFHAKEGATAALDPVVFAANISDLQMKTLEAESSVRRAIARFPSSKTVTSLPEVYRQNAAPTAAPPVVIAPAPTPPPSVTPTPTPTPAPKPVVVRPAPRPSPTPTPTPAPADPYANLLAEEEGDSVTKKWWFWTIVGVGAAAAGGVTAWLLLREPDPATSFTATVTVGGGNP
jgi:hypothetical protein